MRLLVVGICTRAAAWSARRTGGVDVVGLDYFGDDDQRLNGETYALEEFGLPPSPENLLQAAQQFDYTAVTYSASLENHPDLVGRLAEGRLLLGNSPATLRAVRHLPSLARVCRAAGLPMARTLWRSVPAPREATGQRWLCKPRAAGGGHGIRPWASGDGPPGPGMVLQRSIEGQPFSATFVANGREAVLVGLAEGLAGLPQLGAGGYTYCGSIVPPRGQMTALVERLPLLMKMAGGLTRAFGLRGLNGMDLIAGLEGDITLLEVNPRYSASMELIERHYGLPLFAWHMAAITEGRLPDLDLAALLRRSGNRWAKGIIYARADVAAPRTECWPGQGIRDVPHSGAAIPRGAPICTVLYDGPESDPLDGLLARAAWVERQLVSQDRPGPLAVEQEMAGSAV